MQTPNVSLVTLTKRNDRMVTSLIGCGFIGETLAKFIDNEMTSQMELRYVYDELHERAVQLSRVLKGKSRVVERVEEIFEDKDVRLVIEAASQEAARLNIPKALSSGKSVMIMSVGTLADSLFLQNIVNIARDRKVTIHVPSGAIGGLDWIKAAARAGLEQVTITVRKPPLSLEGAPYVTQRRIDLSSIHEPTQIYEGIATQAASSFPANVNVAVALSLAGIGPEKTTVRVIADPTVTRNIHEITATGAAGTITLKVENKPSPTNPKTSWVAALSAIQKLKEMTECLSIGT